ncbi:hypothetical protein [Hyphomonas sp.]|uniref:hypothetical protein n=1 Tax=Hyphomonas sp. TaxID=87 RepID=UPI00391CF4B2
MTRPADPPPETDAPAPATPEVPAQVPAQAPPAAEAAPPRPLVQRLFGISFWGAIKLLGLCILTGFFVMASNFDPRNPGFDPGEAFGAIVSQSFAALGWALRNFWQPALAGALVVLPLWILWRLVSLPFRK